MTSHWSLLCVPGPACEIRKDMLAFFFSLPPQSQEMKDEGTKQASTQPSLLSLLKRQPSNTHQPIFNPLQPIIPNPFLILQQ